MFGSDSVSEIGVHCLILAVQPVDRQYSAGDALDQGFPNWGSRPLKGSRNDLQGSQRVYQLLQERVKLVSLSNS